MRDINLGIQLAVKGPIFTFLSAKEDYNINSFTCYDG